MLLPPTSTPMTQPAASSTTYDTGERPRLPDRTPADRISRSRISLRTASATVGLDRLVRSASSVLVIGPSRKITSSTACSESSRRSIPGRAEPPARGLVSVNGRTLESRVEAGTIPLWEGLGLSPRPGEREGDAQPVVVAVP